MLINKRILILVVGFLLLIFMTPSIFGQEEEVILEDNLFSIGMELGVGARALGMGGAFSYVGGDYSASFWNPAGLTDIRRVEVFGSLSHLMRDNDSQFSGFETTHKATFTELSNFGLAFPIPTYRGSLVLSFGYNRIKSFDENSEFTWFNFTEDDSVVQAWRELENGGLNAWIFSGAIEVTRNISIGLSLNFWTGNDDFELTFRERDEDDIYTFNVRNVETNIESDITGFNVKVGGLYHMARVLRIGASISSPTSFKIQESSSRFEEIFFDDNTGEDFLDGGFFEYKIRSPFTFSGGGSLNFLNFVFSGEVEYNDWSQVRYTTEPPLFDSEGESLTKSKANRLIQDNYRATTKIRAGVEFTPPFTGLSLRAGYFRDPSIFQGALSDQDKQFYTLGLGFLLDKQVKLDLAYVFGFWKNRNVARAETNDISDLVEDIKINKVFATLAFRF